MSQTKKQARQTAARERAAAAGLNEEGIDTSPVDVSDLQERVDTMEAQGYLGITPDPTPNENYTLKTPQSAPTPETDADLHEQARAASHGSSRTAVNTTAAEVASSSTGAKSKEEKAEEKGGEAS